MALPEQKKELLKAKVAVALHDKLGRVPKKEEIDQVFLQQSGRYPRSGNISSSAVLNDQCSANSSSVQ
jgi:hypothetical protein